jgi:hypothetical protein
MNPLHRNLLKLQTLAKFLLTLVFFAIINSGCSSSKTAEPAQLKGEYIYRLEEDRFIDTLPAQLVKRERYPWEEGEAGAFPKITKEFFRCRGSSLNPVQIIQKEKEVVRYYDCGGPQKHSLPLRDGKEFIYPILIDLLNAIQRQTGKRVVITSGHCCPEHFSYMDQAPKNQSSKHTIGAEVDFYVQGMESQPEALLDLLFAYYRDTPRYAGNKDYQEFKRYEKSELSTKPWYNKEIFIKMVKKNEGRDFDNRHPYPYLSIQVRYDFDKQENVTYSWDKAFHNFHRW